MEAGVLEADADSARPLIRLSVIDDLMVAGDAGEDRPATFVVDVSSAAASVAALTVRREVGAALDLGTGSGVHALLAARHADRVVGVDVNPHALSVARVSQHLNRPRERQLGRRRLVRTGARAALRPRGLDPPCRDFARQSRSLWRDSALGGEALSRQLVRESAEHLADGGFATVFCAWTHADGAWDDRPREWVADLGCDSLILKFVSHEPLTYALEGVSIAPGTDRETLPQTIERWMEHYRRAGIEQIAGGVIVLRRSSGTHWTRAFELHQGTRRAGGDQLQRMFAGATSWNPIPERASSVSSCPPLGAWLTVTASIKCLSTRTAPTYRARRQCARNLALAWSRSSTRGFFPS